MSTLLNKPCRISSPNLIRRNVFCHNTSSTYYGTFTNCHRITYNYIQSYEDIIFYTNFTQTKDSAFFVRI